MVILREVRESLGGTKNPGWERAGLGGRRVLELDLLGIWRVEELCDDDLEIGILIKVLKY